MYERAGQYERAASIYIQVRAARLESLAPCGGAPAW